MIWRSVLIFVLVALSLVAGFIIRPLYLDLERRVLWGMIGLALLFIAMPIAKDLRAIWDRMDAAQDRK